MTKYKLKILQARPDNVEADTLEDAIMIAIDSSEWDYEILAEEYILDSD